MTLLQLKALLAKHANSVLPQAYSNILYAATDNQLSYLLIQNTDSHISATILQEMQQQSMTFLISRNETLAGLQPLKSFQFGQEMNEQHVESLVGLPPEQFIEQEKKIIEKNIEIGISDHSTSLYRYINIAKRMKLVNDIDSFNFQPNSLHSRVLNFLLSYRQDHPNFLFWLRERNTRNRLHEGYWLQGNADYAFVGLYNSWSGNMSTKGIGLVFYPSGNDDIGVTFELIFKDETRPQYLRLYQAIIASLRKKYGDELKGENNNHYWIMLATKNGFDVAKDFLESFKEQLDKLVKESGLTEILIIERDFVNKLNRIKDIQSRMQMRDSTLIAQEISSDEGATEENADESVANQNQGVNFNVRLQRDSPAEIDELGRQPFVNSLYSYIKRLWEGDTVNDSYTIHLNGEWGSGKSTVLNLLAKKLENDENKFTDRWIVVEFNAWQNQHVQVPWWIFLDNVYKTILYKSRWWKRPWILLREQAWRLVSMNIGKWITCLLMFMVFLVSVRFASGSFDSSKIFGAESMQTNDKIGLAISIISLIGTIWLFLNGIINSLLPGSEDSALHFKQNVRDPMRKIKEHYNTITQYTSRKVAVFIDDIDRCDPKYVVQLLEGLQTLFRTKKVLYVISGDAKWIRQSFEIHYKDLRETIDQKGQSLGNFFVEKTLQQSVNLPPVTRELKELYWRKLLHGGEVTLRPENYPESVSKINTALSEQQMTEIIKGASSEEERIILREKAALKVSTQVILADIKHELDNYHKLLRPNPRAMKRLINNLAMVKATNFLAGIENQIDPDVVIRWAILRSSYPTVAADIYMHPEKLLEYQNRDKHPEISEIVSDIPQQSLAYLHA